MADGGIHDQLGGGFHRYATDADLARPALRADALRQRPARAGLPRTPGSSPATPRYREVADRHARLHAPRAPPRRRHVRRQPGRGHGGRRGRDVHLDGRRDPRGPRRRRAAVHGDIRRHRRRQLGGHERSSRGSSRPSGDRRTRTRGWRDARATPARAARRAAAAGPRRQGARRLERPRDRRASPTPAVPAGRRPLLESRPSAPPMPSWPACFGPTGGWVDRGRTAERPARASSRTTPTSPTACLRSTRRRSTSAGSRPPASSPT